MPRFIAPSILAADFSRLDREVALLNDSEADWFHCDIMDGRFVPNISFGIPVLEAIKRHARKPLDVHLMMVEPEKYLEAFQQAGADFLTVHYEACPHLHRTLRQIRELGMKAGVALNPHTPVSVLEDVLQEADLLLIMSVNPGFGGQQFIENTYRKVRQARAMISAQQLETLIEIDGGVSSANAGALIEAGADALVAGNFVFRSADPSQTISDLKRKS